MAGLKSEESVENLKIKRELQYQKNPSHLLVLLKLEYPCLEKMSPTAFGVPGDGVTASIRGVEEGATTC